MKVLERLGERRKGRRRSVERGGSDRRRVNRRAAAGVALGVASLTVGAPTIGADVYSRINSKGVLEATNVPANPQDFKLTYRSKGTLVHSTGFRMRASSNTEFDAHIDAAVARHAVSRDLVRAIIQVESAFDNRAVSTAGAQGLMQLMPSTARRFGVTDSFDARQNIFAGTRYLRILLDTYGGDVSLSAAAYNAGEGAVARYNGIPPFPETRNYVRKVNALLGSAVDAVPSGPRRGPCLPASGPGRQAAQRLLPLDGRQRGRPRGAGAADHGRVHHHPLDGLARARLGGRPWSNAHPCLSVYARSFFRALVRSPGHRSRLSNSGQLLPGPCVMIDVWRREMSATLRDVASDARTSEPVVSRGIDLPCVEWFTHAAPPTHILKAASAAEAQTGRDQHHDVAFPAAGGRRWASGPTQPPGPTAHPRQRRAARPVGAPPGSRAAAPRVHRVGALAAPPDPGTRGQASCSGERERSQPEPRTNLRARPPPIDTEPLRVRHDGAEPGRPPREQGRRAPGDSRRGGTPRRQPQRAKTAKPVVRVEPPWAPWLGSSPFRWRATVTGLVHHVYFDRSGLPDLEPFIRFEPPTIGAVYDARGTVLIELAREYRRVVVLRRGAAQSCARPSWRPRTRTSSPTPASTTARCRGWSRRPLAQLAGDRGGRAPGSGCCFPRAARRSRSSSSAATSSRT